MQSLSYWLQLGTLGMKYCIILLCANIDQQNVESFFIYGWDIFHFVLMLLYVFYFEIPVFLVILHSFYFMCFVLQRRKWERLGLWEWAFLVVSILNIALCIILTTLRLVNVVHYDPHSPDFIFTIMLIVNSGMYYATYSRRVFSMCHV